MIDKKKIRKTYWCIKVVWTSGRVKRLQVLCFVYYSRLWCILVQCVCVVYVCVYIYIYICMHINIQYNYIYIYMVSLFELVLYST